MCPLSYDIDTSRRLLRCAAEDRVTATDWRDLKERLKNDPDFDPSFMALVDLRLRVGSIPTISQITALATSPIFCKDAKQAFVVKDDLSFGLTRVFQSHRAWSDESSQVFRSMDDALKWLGL